MNPDGKFSMIKRHKVLLITVPSLIVLVLVALLARALFYRGGDDAQKGQMNEVEQILNAESEPYSDGDELYRSDGKEKKGKYRIEVNKTNNVIVVYQRGDDGDLSEAFKSMCCSVGRDVPTGSYKTGERYLWKYVNSDVWAQYATRLDGAIMFQSVPFREKKKDTLIVKYYNQLGSSCSASAIRLCVADAKWIAENAPEGTKVEVIENDKIGPLGKPNLARLSEDETWDPSDPDEANPWKGYGIKLAGVSDRTVERGIAVDYLDGVRVVNQAGLEVDMEIDVESTVEIFKCGEYKVTYSVSNGSGETVQQTATFKVVDTMKPVFSGIPTRLTLPAGKEITRTELLEGVYVIDNNQFLPTENVQVDIPAEVADGDLITFRVTDAYGNETMMQVACTVDTTPPQVYLREGVSGVIGTDQVVDEAFALSRIEAVDMGQHLSGDHIGVDIIRNEWGYTFHYIVSDNSGLTTEFSNTVTYPMYAIILPEEKTVDDLTNLSLLKGVQLADTLGNTYTVDQIKVSSKIQAGNQYEVTYSYDYTSPLGTKTATAVRVVTLKESKPEPSTSPAPGEDEDKNKESEE